MRAGGVICHIMFLRDFSLVIANKREIGTVTNAEGSCCVAAFGPTHIFDVGANIGLFSWNMLSLFPKAKLFLFEPDRMNQGLLSATICRNGLTAALYPNAVSDHTGVAEFVVDSVSGATGSLIQNANTLHKHYALGAVTTKVETISLDDCVEHVSGPSPRVLLKIDVEGAEALVLAGASNFIRRFRPLIIIECFDLAKISSVLACGYHCTPMETGNYLLQPNQPRP
jgi:FkbM family methyltransferase